MDRLKVIGMGIKIPFSMYLLPKRSLVSTYLNLELHNYNIHSYFLFRSGTHASTSCTALYNRFLTYIASM